jgi:hypothetical protein
LIRLRFRPSLLLLGLALAQFGHAADERGGSFSLVPAVLMPAGRLAQTVHPGPISNLSFDIGISPRWSVIFGAGYADLESKLNREVRLLLAPAWFGFKSKAQIGPSVEVFWDFAAELVYEKLSFTHSGRGSIENLDPAMNVGAGMDLWLTSWLLTGVESRVRLVSTSGELFPFVQLGLRLGLRG